MSLPTSVLSEEMYRKEIQNKLLLIFEYKLYNCQKILQSSEIHTAKEMANTEKGPWQRRMEVLTGKEKCLDVGEKGNGRDDDLAVP